MAVVNFLQDAPQTARVMRRPQHTFALRHRPYQVQPFALAPVLPGETLKSALLQARCVTDPIKNRLIGWWMEHYIFYVPLPALSGATAFEDMVMDPGADMSGQKVTTATVPYYFGASTAGQINWTEQCLEAVVNEFFREDGTVSGDFLLDGIPAAAIHGESWLDSAMLRSALPDGGEIPEDLDNTSYDEFSRLQALYELQRTMGLSNMTYDDWLATYGVKVPKAADPSRPELIRYSKDWTYPTNTVDPATGTPSSACSWAIAERADKDRFFRWPGFIFGVTVARPKVYMSKQKSSAAGLMEDIFSWFPALMQSEAAVGLKSVLGANGPLAGNTGGAEYVVDVRDLLIYGDQFINFALTETNAGLVALPTAALQKRYAPTADIDALFTGVTAATREVEQDGVLSLGILGTQTDRTSGSHSRAGS